MHLLNFFLEIIFDQKLFADFHYLLTKIFLNIDYSFDFVKKNFHPNIFW